MTDTSTAVRDVSDAAGGPADPTGRAGARRWPDLLLLAVVVVVLFWTPLSGQGVFLGVDRLAEHWPWRAVAGVPVPEPLNLYVGDAIDAYYPVQHLTTEGWRDGDLSTWYPTVQAGSAGAPSPPWFPLNLLWLVVPPTYVLGLHAAIRVWLAMAGIYLLLREYGASRWAGLLAGPAYALCAFNANWLSWSHTNVSLLVPLLFLTAERTLRRRSPLAAAGLAALVAAMLYGPFPSVAGYAFAALAGYCLLRTLSLVRAGDRAALGGLALSGAGGVVGFLLAMPYLLPLGRELAFLEVGYRDALAVAHLPLSSMLTWLVPGAFGDFSRAHAYFGPVNPVEAVMFTGTLAVPLALAALWRRRARGLVAVYAAMAAVCLGIALGPLLPLVGRLPLFNNNPNFRISVIASFAVAVLAGFGVDEVLERARARRIRPLVVAWLGVAVLAGGVLLASGYLIDLAATYRTRGLVDYAVGQWGRAVLMVAGLAAVVAAVRWGRLTRPLAGLALAALLLVDVGAYWRSVNPAPPLDRFYPETPGVQFLEQRLGSDRLVGFGAFPGSTASAHDLDSVESHAFNAPSWRWTVTVLQPKPFQSPTFTAFTPDQFNFQAAILAQLRVRYYVDGPTAPPIGQRVVAGNGDPAAGTPLRLGPGQPVSLRLRLPAGRTTGVALRPLTGDPDAVVTIDVRLGGQGFSRTYAFKDARRGALAALSPELRGEGPLEVTVRVAGGQASFGSPDGRTPAVQAFAEDPAAPQGVRLVHAGDLSVYERTGPVAPHAFLAGQVRAGLPDAETFRELSRPPADPTAVALLDGPAPAELDGAAGAGPPGRAEVTAAHAEQLEVAVDAARPALLVVTDAWHPGWSATVDGRPAEVRRANGTFRGVVVPAGRHRVEMRFRPPGMATALPLAGVGAAGLAGLAAAGVLVLVRARRRAARERP